ncbi:electron transfer flavoprotein subunit alpha/FixB family protein [Halogeometricum sp. S1BR25-6]|uniref:Electron transfer flavoprotein subunit alpha/FixB family protein n=1 Tax=Halogeometricum salsisoli TaxID=2950536 RepID=A0ABU2GEL0_9EURY|nr:electron transfer flavoprotein subunit alpha/FixB family protein [Halogeometricum sp. S1BR25-6]MDS0299245.1 electron transfer flavoprotein subunit alpha/FixB family protein [Halogeometricum sp. S1BR25-6]
MTLDPGEYDISELGPKIKDVEDVDELREILEAEKSGENRAGAIALVESRIEKFSEDDEADVEGIDLSAMSAAEVGNALQRVDDPDELERLLQEESEGEDRGAVKRLVQRRLDAVQGSEESEGEESAVDDRPPEERHPDLSHPTRDKRHVRSLRDGRYRDMWVYCETQAGELASVSREMLGKARELMDGYNDRYAGGGDGGDGDGEDGGEERVVAVLVGDDVRGHADDCIALGADVVVVHEDERLERFQHNPYTEIVADMARAGAEHVEGEVAGGREEAWRDYDKPRYFLFPATNNGRDLSALVQAELDSGLASDCSGLYIEEEVISNPVKTGAAGTKRTFERVLHMKRPDFSGFEYSTILCLDNPRREFHPQGASVIPGSFDVPDPDPERAGVVVDHELELDEAWFRVAVTDHERLDEGVDLSGHDVVVAVGRGIGDDPTRGIELALDLAEAFEDAAVGVSRGIVTGSYAFEPHVEQYAREERQIGETGQVVAPDLYVAAGISGAVQHKVGMDESETVVAVNTDPEARIRDFSDFFVEGDLFEVLPTLTEAVRRGTFAFGAAAEDAAATDGGEVRRPSERPGTDAPTGGEGE